MTSKMITDNFQVEIVPNPSLGPTYDEKSPLLKIDKAVIVRQGTIDNAPTVDFQLIDNEGNKYVIMATGRIMETLADCIKGQREMDGVVR